MDEQTWIPMTFHGTESSASHCLFPSPTARIYHNRPSLGSFGHHRMHCTYVEGNFSARTDTPIYLHPARVSLKGIMNRAMLNSPQLSLISIKLPK
jgi:hypothetical protein